MGDDLKMHGLRRVNFDLPYFFRYPVMGPSGQYARGLCTEELLNSVGLYTAFDFTRSVIDVITVA